MTYPGFRLFKRNKPALMNISCTHGIVFSYSVAKHNAGCFALAGVVDFPLRVNLSAILV